MNLARVYRIRSVWVKQKININSNIPHGDQWIVPQFFNLRSKMAKSIVYVITLITNRNHAFHCYN